jgi:hypothetical protein
MTTNLAQTGRSPPVRRAPSRPEWPARGIPLVRFVDGESRIRTLLVESADPGTFLAVIGTLYRLQLQIVGSTIKIRHGLAEHRLHVVELDGAPVGVERQGRVERDVSSAIEDVSHARPPKPSMG